MSNLSHLYDVLARKAHTFREYWDWLGEKVLVFEYGDRDKPVIFLVGGVDWQCLSTTTIISDALVRFDGDTHILLVPSGVPSNVLGAEHVIAKVLGEDFSSLAEGVEKLRERSQKIYSAGQKEVYLYGNLLVVFSSVELSRGDLEDLLRNLSTSFPLYNQVVMTVSGENVDVFLYSEDGIKDPLCFPFLQELFQEISTLNPVVTVVLRCCENWGIKLLGDAAQEHRTLAELLLQQLGVSGVGLGNEPSKTECLTGSQPVIEICVPGRISEEESEKVVHILHSLFNAAYLLAR